LKVLHKYFFIISNEYPLLVIVVCTEACDEHVKEKHEIRNHIDYGLPVFTVDVLLKGNKVRHKEGHIEEEQHDHEGPGLLELGVRMDVEVKLARVSVREVP
jgi:hypothetical protein